MPEKYIILIPQFNDWEALNLLIEKINTDVAGDILAYTSVLVVDDCSSVIERGLFPLSGVRALKY